MSKVKNVDLSNVQTWQDLRQYASILLSDLVTQFNGSVSFTDNCQTFQGSITFTGANKSIKLAHTLNKVPSGYIVVGRDSAITIFDGSPSATSSEIYLQASGAGTATVMVY